MAAQIQIFQQSPTLVRARFLFPQQQVEVSMTLAPGDNAHALLQEQFAQLAPSYGGTYNAARDIPALTVPVLSSWDGNAWT